MGKTIEAGLLISQKCAEKKNKILIICPANLRKQQTKISILKKFIGKSGYLSVELLKMHAYDDEEILLLAGHTDAGESLSEEEIHRLFSLEANVKELELEIKQTKKEAIQQISLEAKLNLQRKAKDLEKKRKDLRLKLYDLQDAIDIEKENLISMTEQKLKAEISLETVFRIKWALI